ncbi:MAG: Calx-beta domain-containing protein [Cyanobacteria bacterium J06643_13]
MEEDSIIYVDADATDGEETGESWGDAYTDLQDALAAAGASDQIWVAEGTYVPTTTVDREISFVINNGVKVYGGFLGNETTLDQRDIENNETILSGNIGADTQADNSYHVVNINGSPSSTLIDGFTITEGQADGDSGFARQDHGGAFLAIDNASATLSNLRIEDNFAADDGGAIYIERGSDLAVDSVVFTNNSSSVDGGAIYIGGGSSLEVFNSLFLENQAVSGGAIFTNNLTTLNVVGNTFYDNDAGANSDDIADGTFNASNRTISNNIFADSERIDSLKLFFDIRLDSIAIDISNNIIEGTIGFNSSRVSSLNDLGESAEDNLLDVNPLFVDADEGDFRLQLDSPGVDAGNNDLADPDDTDVAGNPRVYTDEVDIGAYEYGLYLSIDDVRVIEGDRGESDAEFTVTLSDSLNLEREDEVTVEYTTFNRSARSGQDFERVTGTLTFDSDTNTRTISVPINGDTSSEFSETFDVGLRRATGGAVITDSIGTGIIQNDDQLPAGTRSDRFFAPEVEASFYTPTAAEREEILDLLSDLDIDTTDGIAFFLEPTPEDT